MRTLHYFLPSLRSWRYCVGARLKFWRRSRVPKKGSKDEAVERGFAARDRSGVKSHSTILQRLRRQISLDYYTIPPATKAIFCRYPGTGSRTSVDCPKESRINFVLLSFKLFVRQIFLILFFYHFRLPFSRSSLNHLALCSSSSYEISLKSSFSIPASQEQYLLRQTKQTNAVLMLPETLKPS